MGTFFNRYLPFCETDLSRRGNNFDFIRLVAASMVLFDHSFHLNGSSLDWDPFRALFSIEMRTVGVIVFFIISGFLVAHSWQNKKNIFDFALARILRVYPAAIVVVLLSVFVLGYSLTTLSTADYFSHPATHQYLQNMSLDRMYYYLPGVFEQNPDITINGSLWTLPYEFTCYIVLGIIGIIGLLRKWGMLIILVLLSTLYLFRTEELNQIIIPVIGIDFRTFIPLLLYFLSGMTFYLFRDKIRFHIAIALLTAIAMYFMKNQSYSDYIYVFTLPYLVFSIAFFKPLRLQNIGKYGDFSYGIYLYAFPVQQLIVYLSNGTPDTSSMIVLSFICTLPFAAFSWYLIEKPALSLRRRLIPKN